ncbi:MAG: hypothetical protein ACRD2B_03940 [Terriglobia bacterium]
MDYLSNTAHFSTAISPPPGPGAGDYGQVTSAVNPPIAEVAPRQQF